MHSSVRALLFFLAIVTYALASGSRPVAQQRPTFSTGVDLIRLDVTAVTADGDPVHGLTAEDFDVEVNGQARPVRSLQFIDHSEPEAAPHARVDFSTNTATTGRLTVVVVDEQSLIDGNEREVIQTLSAFLGRMRPQDRTALISLPGRAARVDFTSDTAVLRKAAERIRAWPISARAPEPIQIDRGEGGLLAGFQTPDRLGLNPVTDTLTKLMGALRRIDGPKSLVFVSGGLPGGTLNLSRYHEFAQEAAAARVTLYVVRVVSVVMDIYTSTGVNETPDTSLDGLNLIAGASGGVVLNALARGRGVFDQIQRETTASYLIGVEPPADLPADKPLKIAVRVRRPAVLVRGPKQMLPPLRAPRTTSAKAAVGEALRQPRVATDLPLRVGTFVTRDATPNRLKLIVLTEAGRQDRTTGSLTWGYELRDSRRVVADGFDEHRLNEGPPILLGATTLQPGTYSLSLAVTDDEGRRGSVRHPVTAELHGEGSLKASDLFVGEAVDGRFRPRLGFPAGTRQIVAVLELYPTLALRDVTIDLVLRDADDIAQRSGQVTPPHGDGPKHVVQVPLSVRDLGPGIYHLSATINAGGRPVATVRRSIMMGL